MNTDTVNALAHRTTSDATAQNSAPAANADQAALWNGDAGSAWIETQPLIDGAFAPFENRLVEAVRAASARRVLDVGCGTGATTLAIARALGQNGSCTGIDISAPMIDLARVRAARDGVRADFICADVQAHPFERAAFDMITSRFGVMFFDDPVAAFANLHRAARSGATLELIAWRSPADNAFMTAAERAAAPLLPELPPRQPDAPGQFAFANGDRVRRILEQSGWSALDIRPLDVRCAFPARELDRYLTRLGPLGRVLPGLDEAARERVLAAVRPAFAPFVHGTEVRFDAACWEIRASA